MRNIFKHNQFTQMQNKVSKKQNILKDAVAETRSNEQKTNILKHDAF